MLSAGIALLVTFFALATPAAAQDASQVPYSAVPLPAQLALRELHGLQSRERALWDTRNEHCIGCGAAAIALGTPFACTFVPWGALFLAWADEDWDDDGGARMRRVGGSLLAMGLAGLTGMIWGSYKVSQGRRARRAGDLELSSIAERRTLLENVLEAFLTGAPAQPAAPPYPLPIP